MHSPLPLYPFSGCRLIPQPEVTWDKPLCAPLSADTINMLSTLATHMGWRTRLLVLSPFPIHPYNGEAQSGPKLCLFLHPQLCPLRYMRYGALFELLHIISQAICYTIFSTTLGTYLQYCAALTMAPITEVAAEKAAGTVGIKQTVIGEDY